MHELGITRSLVELVRTEAEKQGFTRTLEIRLKVGEYSGVIPDYILDLFPHVAKDTAAEGAALVFETVPGRFLCAGCGREGPVDRKAARCPACGGADLKLTAGREFFVDSLKVE